MAWLVCAALLLPSCRSSDGPALTHDAVEPDAAALPAYEALYESAERRIATLDRLWARAVVGLRYRDEDGDLRRDQLEGHFQVVRPERVALLLGKLGETYLVLGSDAERYWWIDLDQSRAAVGDRTRAAGLSVEELGVPLLPGDLLLALDLIRWPPPGDASVLGVTWSDRPDLDQPRTAAVRLAEGSRVRVVHIDVFTLDPMGVDLLDADGTQIGSSLLTQHGRVLNRAGLPVEPRMTGRAVIEVPELDVRADFTFSGAEVSPRRPKPAAFDLDELLRRFRVTDVRRIGETLASNR